MTNLLHINDIFVTIHNVFLNPTVNLNALCKSCVKIARVFESIFGFLYADSRIQTAIGQFISCIQLSFFYSLLFFRKAQTKIWRT